MSSSDSSSSNDSVTLREYLRSSQQSHRSNIEQRFEQNDKYLESRLVRLEATIESQFASTEKAILKAEAANDKRFESVNEFRVMLNDMVRTLMPRSEVVNRFETMQQSLTQTSDRLNISQGAVKGLQSGWLVLVALIGATGALIGIFGKVF